MQSSFKGSPATQDTGTKALHTNERRERRGRAEKLPTASNSMA